METSRGKKGKKAAWHLSLGLKDVVFAGMGVVGLMMMSFTLGTLAGRGDIYRVAYTWGLLTPEPKPQSQELPQSATNPAPASPEATAASPAPAASTAAPAASAPAPAPPPNLASLPGGPAVKHEAAAHPAVPKGAHPAPITGSMAPLPPPAAASPGKKSSKAAQAQREQKAREDQQHRERQEVASKLTFLNSFDTTSKPGHKKEKAAAKPQPPTLVKVGAYRDSKSAQAKLAELQKKGIKATLKQAKDAKGTCYTVYRQNPPAHAKEGDNLAQKKEKPAAANPKPRVE